MKLSRRNFSKLLLFLFAFALAGCGLFDSTTKVVLDTSAISEEVRLEEFNLSEIVIEVTKNNNTVRIPLEESMLSSGDLALLKTAGTHTIVFEYLDVQLSFTVTLVENPLDTQLRVIYKLAQTSGNFSGTYEDWLASISGKDGISITNATIDASGNLILTLSNNKTINVGKVTGSTGPKGEDGCGISKLEINNNGELIITFSDQSSINLGIIIGSDGQNGKDGVDGQNGKDGVDGQNGKDGVDGQNGKDGVDGQNGNDGLSAYEIYLKYNPDYQGTELDWLNDLINGNLKVTEKFTVVLNLQGGNLPPEENLLFEVAKGNTITLPLPTKEGYIFLGWVTGFAPDDTLFSNDTPVFKDLNLYATWELSSNTYTITYDKIEEIGVKQLKDHFILGINNHIYVYDQTIINTVTREKEYLFHDITNDFNLDNDDFIEEILIEREYRLVFRTNKNRFFAFGLATNNEYGQLGLGHRDPIYENLFELFSNIELLPNEMIEIVQFYDTYNIVITSQKRVFFTGTMFFDENMNDYFEQLYPLEITNEFQLDENEYFINYEDNFMQIFDESSDIIVTNKRIFIPAKVLNKIEEQDISDKLYLDATEMIGSVDSVMMIIVLSQSGIMWFNYDGTIFEFHDDYIQNMKLKINENELLTTIDLYNGIFITNQNRILYFEEPDSEPIEYTDIDINGKIINVFYLFIDDDELTVYQTDTNNFYLIHFDKLNYNVEIEDISYWFENIVQPLEIVFSGYDNNHSFIYANNKYYKVLSGGLVEYTIPTLTTYEKTYPIGEVTLDPYHNDKYAIEGWVDENYNLVDNVYLTSDLDLHLKFANYLYVNIFDGETQIEEKYISGDLLDLDSIISKFTIPYGYEFSELVDCFTDEVYNPNTPIKEHLNLRIVFKKLPGNDVGIAYLDNDDNYVYYDNIFVIMGDKLVNTNLGLQLPDQYKVLEYYFDKECTISFDLNTEINDSIIIYAKVVENDKRIITFVMPYGLEPIIIDYYIGNNLYDLDYYNQINEKIDQELYLLKSIYLDDEFINQYDVNYDDCVSDLLLYVELYEAINIITIGKDDYGNILFEKEIKSFYGIQANDLDIFLEMPQYKVMGAYLDSDLTNEVLRITESSTIYLKMAAVKFCTVNIIFDLYPELNYSIVESEGAYFSHYRIYERLDSFEIYLNIEGLYLDQDYQQWFNGEVDNDMDLYVKTNPKEVYRVEIVFPDYHVPSLTILTFSRYIYLWNVTKLVNLYLPSQNKEEIDISDLFYDAELTLPFTNEVTEDITLYAVYSVKQYFDIKVHVDGETNFTLQSPGTDCYEIESYLRYKLQLDFDILELYFDEAYTIPVNDLSNIQQDIQVYVKLIKYPIIVTYIFNQYNLPQLQIRVDENYVINNDNDPYFYIHTQLTNISNMIIYLYYDSEFIIPYNYEAITSDVRIYVKVQITFYPQVSIAFVNQKFDFTTSYLYHNIVDIDFIESVLRDNSYYYNISNLKIYLDPECTIEYLGTEITDDIVLFVTFDL